MNGFLRRIALLSLLRLLVEMLLPEGAMRKMGDLIMGLILMLSMLEALHALLYGGLTR
ncbi:MAG: stage III sporulation protein AF [Clostridia bacterium]|nr:stage III sporulation protein AF [Clostridia bacterium]MBR6786425.1 stage III sporulation protein AF [Clostridia bacterium]